MPKTLLLADDSVTIQKVVGISFASEDIEVVSVDNGSDALTLVREKKPDVVLADVVMPGMNGYELCEAIKGEAQLAHIPVILLTGTFEAFDEERARIAGASGHVAKPFEAQTLVDRVKTLLASSESEGIPIPPETQPAAPRVQVEAVDMPTTPDVQTTESNGDAFDFFDEDLESPNEDSQSGDAALRFESDEAPFAFGDEEPELLVDNELSGTQLATPAPPPEATVALLPEDDAADLPMLATPSADSVAREIPVARTERETQTDTPETLEELIPVADESANLAADATVVVDDDFDFAFESATAESKPASVTPSSDSLMPAAEIPAPPSVEADDLAQATVLDPLGASGYDVSSSDLGDPFEAELLDVAPAPAASAASEAPTPNPFQAAASEPEAEPMIEPAATPAVEPSAEAVVPAVAKPAMDDALAALQPQLAQQLHETLEKMAWEAFSEVSEKIVKQAVERIEKAAWEVIPQLAETLIREEIRRIKGDSESS